MKPVLDSEITCPECGHQEVEKMPENACQYFYECKSCKSLLKPKRGDCCVFCSYGDTPCPPIQLDQSCC
ncbi:GDCCVxC domain-containing (seleno)protein [Halomonas aquatica]|uniref:GDCCVxC domain-containing (Seleno)protein n=1 Tax=Halomonas aquatica TaxID=3151123 RepID=A0ABV1NFF7_9GAMM